MEITNIRPVRKRLSMVYIDGEPAMKLDTFTLEAEGVRPGMHITDEDLQELVQKESKVDLVYELVKSDGPDHDKHFVSQVSHLGKVLGVGEGKTKKEAEKQAKENASKEKV